MADPKLIQEWLQKADEDLGFAASIIEDSPFYAQSAFICNRQQKVSKAIIVLRIWNFKKSTTWWCFSNLSGSQAGAYQLDAGLQIVEPVLYRHSVPGPLAYGLFEGKALQAQAAAVAIRDTIKGCLK